MATRNKTFAEIAGPKMVVFCLGAVITLIAGGLCDADQVRGVIALGFGMSATVAATV